MANNLQVNLLIKAKDQASGVFSKIKKNLGGIAVAAASFISVKFFAGAVKDAQALQQEMGTLGAIIESTGQAAGLTAEEIIEMSKRLDEQTLGNTDSFIKASESLLTFKSVGKDVFESTLSLAQDLASAGFGSLETNAIQLGKALEDPVLGLNALRRSGVSFTDEQKQLIKSLVETGDKAKAQGIILEALTKQVGGAGAGAGGGLSGAIDLVGKRMQDFKEQLGQGMLAPLQKVNTILAEFIQRLTQSGAITTFGNAIGSAFNGLVELSIKVFDKISAIYDRLADTGAIASFKTAYSDAFSALLSLVTQLHETFGRLYDTITNSQTAKQSVEALSRVLTTLIQGATLFATAFTTGLTTIEAVFHGLTGVAESFWSTIQSGLASFKANMAAITFGDVSARWQAEADASKAASEEWAAAAEDSFARAEQALIKTADNAQKTTQAAIDLGKEYQQAGEQAAESGEKFVSAEREKAKAIVETGSSAKKANADIIEGNTQAAESISAVVEQTKEATKAMTAYQESIQIAGQQQQFFNNIIQETYLAEVALAKAQKDRIAAQKAADAARDQPTIANAFSEEGSAAFSGLNDNQITGIQRLIDAQNDAAGRGNTGRVKLDIEKMVIAMAANQKATEQSNATLKEISVNINRLEPSVNVNVDGREIAASITQAGLTAR